MALNTWSPQARRFLHALREQDLRTVSTFTTGRCLRAVGGRPLRSIQQAPLGALNVIGHATLDPLAMAVELGCPEADFREYVREFDSGMQKAEQASSSTTLLYPDIYRSESHTLRVLYSLVRAHRPHLLLETGIADGFSSFAILLALEANGEGHLHSVDISEDVGSFVPNNSRSRWTMHIHHQGLERGLKEIVANFGQIDFYYHDSGHSYLWQAFEYATVAPKIAKGGIFFSDDIDSSFAFIDHCQAAHEKAAVMVEARKVVGGYVKGLGRSRVTRRHD